jgi:hypothetical protein
VDPLEAVAAGAALHAATWTGEPLPAPARPRLLEVAAEAVAIEVGGVRVRCFERSEPLPATDRRRVAVPPGADPSVVRVLERDGTGAWSALGTLHHPGLAATPAPCDVDVTVHLARGAVAVRLQDPTTGLETSEVFPTNRPVGGGGR